MEREREIEKEREKEREGEGGSFISKLVNKTSTLCKIDY